MFDGRNERICSEVVSVSHIGSCLRIVAYTYAYRCIDRTVPCDTVSHIICNTIIVRIYLSLSRRGHVEWGVGPMFPFDLGAIARPPEWEVEWEVELQDTHQRSNEITLNCVVPQNLLSYVRFNVSLLRYVAVHVN